LDAGRDFGTLENMKRLLMLTSAAAMIGMAAPAYADPSGNSGNDADFLKHLSNAGLTFQDPAQAISVAKNVCDLSDKGTSGTEIVDNLQKLNPGFTGDGAARFTGIAANDYCPKYSHSGGQSAQGQAPQGQPPEAQSSQGQPPQGQPPEAQPPQGQPPEAQPPEGQPSQGQSPEGQPPKPPGA
jgi:hypothetical protein